MTIEFRCARCRQHLRVPDESTGKHARCPRCETLLRIPLPAIAADPSVDNRAGLPWEQAPRKSPRKFFETARLIAFSPTAAFRQMKQRGRLGEAMFYSAIGQTIGVVGMESWHLAFIYFGGQADGFDKPFLHKYMTFIGLLVLGYLPVGVPLMATLGNLIAGAVLHFCLILCGGSRQPFSTSIRISCYSQSSLTWLLWIPGGALVVGVWSLGLNIYAVHLAHEVPMGRAVLAVLLPMIVVMVVFVVSIIILAITLLWMLAV